jgi:hypothetical protein
MEEDEFEKHNGMTNVKLTCFYFMFCWPCITIHLCNKNQLGALFIVSVFRQSTCTCFRHICSPSRGILYIYNSWYMLCFLVDCLLVWPTVSQLKSTTRTNCLYTVYLLMMGYRYARKVDWRNKLRINSMSSSFLLHRVFYLFIYLFLSNQKTSLHRFLWADVLSIWRWSRRRPATLP